MVLLLVLGTKYRPQHWQKPHWSWRTRSAEAENGSSPPPNGTDTGRKGCRQVQPPLSPTVPKVPRRFRDQEGVSPPGHAVTSLTTNWNRISAANSGRSSLHIWMQACIGAIISGQILYCCPQEQTVEMVLLGQRATRSSTVSMIK